jgi:hypothetical protein
MIRVASLLLLLLAAFGCAPQYVEYAPYHEDGTKKPHIAFVQMADSTEFNKIPDLSQELTKRVCDKIMQHGELYLFTEEATAAMASKAGKPDYFGQDLSFTKAFQQADFIVATEVVEHKIASRKEVKSSLMSHCTPGNSLVQLKVRLEVIDPASNPPKVLLQEVVKINHAIPNSVANNPQELKGYEAAHDRLVDEIAARIENSILGTK